jgi:glycosyltransferase involved in cell wall biosynthesis
MKVSVIIRTLNPHRETLGRVLQGLRGQSHPLEWTELLIIDNGSEPPLDAASLGLDWHPRARVVREDARGKIMAQRRGVCEAAPDCDLLLFVDDDNLLQDDYLAAGARIASEFPHLGAWGSGSIHLVFQQPPPKELRNLSWLLATLDYPYDVWSSLRDINYSIPVGAGMFVRRRVAEAWVKVLDASPLRRALWTHRQPPILFSEDTDLALTAPDLNLGTGVFPGLRIEHLVRAEKLNARRMLQLVENQQIAEVFLRRVRSLGLPTRGQRWRSALEEYARLIYRRGFDRRAQWHRLRGQARGRRIVRDYLAQHPEETPPPTPQPWDPVGGSGGL